MEKTEQEKKLMQSQIDLFEKKYGWVLEVKDDRPYCSWDLCCISDYLPDNLEIDGNLLCNVHSTKLPSGLKVNGSLVILETFITEIPDDCEFKSLNISETQVTKLRDNLVLDYLDARNAPLTNLPKNLKVKGGLHVSYTNITEIPDDCEFGALDIENIKVTKLRDDLVLDYLYASNSALAKLPKGLKVKSTLSISNTNITEIPDDCEFKSLNISGTKVTKLRDNLTLDSLIADNSYLKEIPKNLVVFNTFCISKTPFTVLPYDCLSYFVSCDFKLNDERYEKNIFDTYLLKDEIVHINHPSGREFLHVDGIFSEVVEKKGDVYHVCNGVNKPISYVVTDGNNHWAHGKTLEEAKQDLMFKINNRDKSDYEKLTLDSELTFNEAVVCYRVITGACKLGTQYYLEHRLPKPHKEKYTIKEMIELTKNEYGGDTFREFFENSISICGVDNIKLINKR
jgi:hypothetical protein